MEAEDVAAAIFRCAVVVVIIATGIYLGVYATDRFLPKPSKPKPQA